MKSKTKPPVQTLGDAHRKAMDLIGGYEDGCAIFMIAGEVHAIKGTSASYRGKLRKLAKNLVGVYDLGADSRQVLEDLRVFYQEAA